MLRCAFAQRSSPAVQRRCWLSAAPFACRCSTAVWQHALGTMSSQTVCEQTYACPGNQGQAQQAMPSCTQHSDDMLFKCPWSTTWQSCVTVYQCCSAKCSSLRCVCGSAAACFNTAYHHPRAPGVCCLPLYTSLGTSVTTCVRRWRSGKARWKRCRAWQLAIAA